VLTGHTFTGHTTACAAGVAVQTIIKRERLIERVRTDGPVFLRMLREALEPIEAVGDIRGRGFFVGIEFVANRATRHPFDPSAQLAHRIGRAAAHNGLLCYPSMGNVDGICGDTVILAPPYNTSLDQLREIAELFAHSIRRAVDELHTAAPTQSRR
jgi:adenosylmethionine-8-amino-7-oxononanoate aminotransferase